MSTRSTTHFLGYRGEVEAIIYRHYDGYPEGAGMDIRKFFNRLEDNVADHRFSDASYLAAKYVVYLAEMFQTKNGDTLDFLGLGVLKEDPFDIEYRYTINCDKFDEDLRPTVTCHNIYADYFLDCYWAEGAESEVQ